MPEIELEGAEAVIVGRSILVGRPLASLLLNAQRHGHRLSLAHPRSAPGCAAAPTSSSPPSARRAW